MPSTDSVQVWVLVAALELVGGVGLGNVIGGNVIGNGIVTSPWLVSGTEGMLGLSGTVTVVAFEPLPVTAGELPPLLTG
jgi:hypothetical protein